MLNMFLTQNIKHPKFDINSISKTTVCDSYFVFFEEIFKFNKDH